MESLMELFNMDHANTLYALAGLSVIVELTILGIGGPLLFLAIGLLSTGILVDVSVISGWEAIILSVAVQTTIATLLLWKPLKSFQNKGDQSDTSSDMIGQVVPVSVLVNADGGKIRHSGINWSARLYAGCPNSEIAVGMKATITAVDGTVMIVSPVIPE
jgi:membrane protein implicated in regulation of membrane protease activity